MCVLGECVCVCVCVYVCLALPDTDIMFNSSTRLKPASYGMGPSSSGVAPPPPVAKATVAERPSRRSSVGVPSLGITVADR